MRLSILAKCAATGCAAIALLAGVDLRADQFALKGGGQLRGELVNSDEVAPEFLTVKTAQGGTIVLAVAEVVDAKLLTAEERRYQELLPQMPDTVDGLWAMAEWCRENRLDEQRQLHLEQILQREKDHRGARAALGYTQLGGRWIITSEWREQQGFVRDGASWKLPQQVLLGKQADRFEEREIEWKKKVKIWRSLISRRGDQQALKELRAVDDPAAAAVYADALADEPSREMRKIYIAVLGRMTVSSAATTALVRHALDDDDEQVRDAALDELGRNQVSSAVTTFLRALEHDDNVLINRAAVALSRMGDRRAIVPLMDVLVTEHKQVLKSGGGPGQLGASFGGSGGLSVGGSTKVVNAAKKNTAVYHALVSMTNANFGYNEEAWRQWYAKENTPNVVTLRRDE